MPQVFKIAVLKDIVSLFPSDKKPFYAGFGLCKKKKKKKIKIRNEKKAGK